MLFFVSYGGFFFILFMFVVGVLVNIFMFNKYEKKYKNKVIDLRELKSV